MSAGRIGCPARVGGAHLIEQHAAQPSGKRISSASELSSSGPRRASVRLAPLRSAPAREAPRRSARLRSARTSKVLTSCAPRRSTMRWDSPPDTAPASTGAPADGELAGAVSTGLAASVAPVGSLFPARSPATARPMTMPIPTAPHPAAVVSAAVTLTHWPTAATATRSAMGQNHGDFAAPDGIHLGMAIRHTYRPLDKTRDGSSIPSRSSSCTHLSRVSTFHAHEPKLKLMRARRRWSRGSSALPDPKGSFVPHRPVGVSPAQGEAPYPPAGQGQGRWQIWSLPA